MTENTAAIATVDDPAAPIQMVREFHAAFSHPIDDPATASRRVGLRLEWVMDELFELLRAVHQGDLVEIADAIADACYFIYGTAVEFGADLTLIPPDPVASTDPHARRTYVKLAMELISDAALEWAFEHLSVPSLMGRLAAAERALRELAMLLDIPLTAVLAEVHRSNTDKLWSDGLPHYRADGKVAKPEGWTAPDVRGVIELHRAAVVA